MIKEQADKIADNILKDFYIEREKEAFTRSEFKSWFSSKISAAIVDASKVTEENQILTSTNSSQISSSFEDYYKKKYPDPKIELCVRDIEFLESQKQFAQEAYLAGQKSNALKLPSDLCEILEAYKEYSRRQTYKGSQLSFLAGVEWAKGKIKALNECECEGESGEK